MFRNHETKKEKPTQNDKLYNYIQKMKRQQAAASQKKASA